MDVLVRLDQIRAAVNVLEHPFYQRWSAGALSAQELGVYAAEYRRAVVALAEASKQAAGEAGPTHAAGLRGHAEEVRDPQEQVRVRARLDAGWPAGERDDLVRIRAEQVTGRRLPSRLEA